MNAYLKEIVDLRDIKKELTSYIARHNFATTVTLANKVSIKNIAKMLSHKDVKMTMHYADVVNQILEVLNPQFSIKHGVEINKFHNNYFYIRLHWIVFHICKPIIIAGGEKG